jgi:hypothetical protein
VGGGLKTIRVTKQVVGATIAEPPRVARSRSWEWGPSGRATKQIVVAKPPSRNRRRGPGRESGAYLGAPLSRSSSQNRRAPPTRRGTDRGGRPQPIRITKQIVGATIAKPPSAARYRSWGWGPTTNLRRRTP